MAKAKKVEKLTPLQEARLLLARHEGVIARLVGYLGLEFRGAGDDRKLEALDVWLTEQERILIQAEPF